MKQTNHNNNNQVTWFNWTVPPSLVGDYVFKLVLVLMLLPSLFGLQFTKLGLIVNLLAVDLFVYLSYRIKGYL